MEYGLALFVTYGSHLVDGNLVTDRLSIGGKTSFTGPDPPAPAIVGGLNTHAVFEGRSALVCLRFDLADVHVHFLSGDTSMTRGMWLIFNLKLFLLLFFSSRLFLWR